MPFKEDQEAQVVSPLSQRLALSTCWCSHRHEDGYEMLNEIRRLGFRRAELSHGIRVSLVPGILRAVEEGWIEISSVHNFCPLPAGVDRAAPNHFEPSARKRPEAAAWLRYSIQTVEFARRVGAAAVVLHAGSVSARFGDATRLIREASRAGSPIPFPEKSLRKLRNLARAPGKRVEAQLAMLSDHAVTNGVSLALENREGVLELPLDSDFDEFFRSATPSSPLFYWHDTGHAEIKRRLGLLNPDTLLEQMAGRLCGFHLHDVDESARDHRRPGSGSVDFEGLRRHIKPEHTLVLELSPALDASQVAASRDFLIEALSPTGLGSAATGRGMEPPE